MGWVKPEDFQVHQFNSTSYIWEAIKNGMNELSSYRNGKPCTAIFVSPNVPYNFKENLDYNLTGYIKERLKKIGKQCFDIDFMNFGKKDSFNYNFTAMKTMEGSKILIRQRIQASNMERPPLIIPANIKVGRYEVPSKSLFEDSTPSYIIHIGNCLDYLQRSYLIH